MARRVTKAERKRRISQGVRRANEKKRLELVNSLRVEGVSIFDISVRSGLEPADIKRLFRKLDSINRLVPTIATKKQLSTD